MVLLCLGTLFENPVGNVVGTLFENPVCLKTVLVTLKNFVGNPCWEPWDSCQEPCREPCWEPCWELCLEPYWEPCCWEPCCWEPCCWEPCWEPCSELCWEPCFGNPVLGTLFWEPCCWEPCCWEPCCWEPCFGNPVWGTLCCWEPCWEPEGILRKGAPSCPQTFTMAEDPKLPAVGEKISPCENPNSWWTGSVFRFDIL